MREEDKGNWTSQEKLQDFYENKRVLITGHTGFIGSWLTKCLLTMGANILGYSLEPPSKPNMYNAIGLGKYIRDLRGDVRDLKSLKQAIFEFQPEIVFHLAAQPIVLESYDNPVETFETNVMGTVNLLESLRRLGSAKVIIVMTSDKVYRNNEWVYPYRENDSLGGKDPYSASKSSQDIVVNSFRESYFDNMGVGISSIRAGNVIGGGDWGVHRIVPDVVRGLMEGGIIRIRNPDSVRPWQFVLEPISGILLLALKMWGDFKFSGEWNFGPNNQREITVRELVDKFIENWGNGSYSIVKSNKAREANYLQLDISKAKNKLNWLPKYNIEDSLKKTVEWYNAYYEDKGNINNVTERQIKAYFEGRKNE
jgi:CDP-glucose 4,6-dehydratase